MSVSPNMIQQNDRVSDHLEDMLEAPKLKLGIRILGYLTIASLVVIQVLIGWTNLPPIESHTYLMLLYNMGELQLDPRSLYGLYVAHGQLPITYLQAFVARLFGLAGDSLAYLELYHVLLKFVLLAVLVIWTRYVVGASVRNKLIFVCLLIGAFVSFPTTELSFAYNSGSFTYFVFQLGTTVNAALFLGITLWLVGKRTWAYVTLFLVSFLHPTSAVLGVGIFLAFDMLQFIRKQINLAILKTSVLLGCLSMILIVPDLLNLFASSDTRNTFAPYLFDLLAFSNPRHLFPWRDSHLIHFVSIALAVFIFLEQRVLVSMISAETRHKLRFAYFFVLAVCLLNIVLVEGLHVVSLGGDKILARIFVVVDFLYAVLFVTILWGAFQKRELPLFVFLYLSYLCFVIGNFNTWEVLLSSVWLGAGYLLGKIVLLPADQSFIRRRLAEASVLTRGRFSVEKILWAWSLSGISLVGLISPVSLDQIQTMMQAMLAGQKVNMGSNLVFPFFSPTLAAAILFVGLLLALFYYGRVRRTAWPALFVLGSTLLIINGALIWKVAIYRENRQDLIQTGEISAWIKTNTEKSALFLTPFRFGPYLTPSVIQRNVIVDYEVWDTFNYFRDILPGTVKAWKVVYDIDLLEKSKSESSRMTLAYLTESVYADLDSRYSGFDASWIMRIKGKYPALGYFVFPLTSLEQAEEIKARFSMFEPVYQDSHYLLFRIGDRTP